MNTAEEVNDHGARCGVLELSLAGNIIRNQQTKTWSRIGFQKEVDRATRFLCSSHTQRRQNSMIDGVIQEQDLGRFNNDGSNRQKSGTDKPVYERTSSIAKRD